MHDDDVRNPRRTGSRVSFSAGKTKLEQCVFLRRRRVLVLWLVALVMAFKNVRNLLLTMALSMMVNLLFCTTSMHRKTSTFRTIRTHLLTWKSLTSLRVLQSFALENEIYEFWRSFANPWHDYLQSALCLWWTRMSLHAAKAAFVPMQETWSIVPLNLSQFSHCLRCNPELWTLQRIKIGGDAFPCFLSLSLLLLFGLKL